jgi:succinate--hydroxymethylglutarate CoA-transferase
VFQDPHIEHIKLVKEIDHPVAGKMKVVGPPVKYSYSENAIRRSPPTLGQHTSEILKSVLNYSEETIEKLKLDKVIQ